MKKILFLILSVGFLNSFAIDRNISVTVDGVMYQCSQSSAVTSCRCKKDCSRFYGCSIILQQKNENGWDEIISFVGTGLDILKQCAQAKREVCD